MRHGVRRVVGGSAGRRRPGPAAAPAAAAPAAGVSRRRRPSAVLLAVPRPVACPGRGRPCLLPAAGAPRLFRPAGRDLALPSVAVVAAGSRDLGRRRRSAALAAAAAAPARGPPAARVAVAVLLGRRRSWGLVRLLADAGAACGRPAGATSGGWKTTTGGWKAAPRARAARPPALPRAVWPALAGRLRAAGDGGRNGRPRSALRAVRTAPPRPAPLAVAAGRLPARRRGHGRRLQLGSGWSAPVHRPHLRLRPGAGASRPPGAGARLPPAGRGCWHRTGRLPCLIGFCCRSVGSLSSIRAISRQAPGRAGRHPDPARRAGAVRSRSLAGPHSGGRSWPASFVSCLAPRLAAVRASAWTPLAVRAQAAGALRRRAP